MRPRASLFIAAAALVIVGIGACSRSGDTADAGSQEAAWVAYEGAWFRIHYPPGFTPRPSLPSTTAEGYDSVFFGSPDGRVEFYVCAPQWGREASDIAVDPAREVVASEKQLQKGAEVHRLWTIAAKDESYTRSYKEVSNLEGNTNFVVGFRYVDADAAADYRASYERFADSLEQFAD